MKVNPEAYENLYHQIAELIQVSKVNIHDYAQQVMLKTYWEIGKHLVDYEQKGRGKADYKDQTVRMLSKELILNFGKGFSLSNLYNMRAFYLRYPIFQTSGKLTWGHYIELAAIDDNLERAFYEKQTTLENWSIRELKRQKSTLLFHRIALSTDKMGVLKLAEQDQSIEQPIDIIRDPYVLEFLKIPEPYRMSERDLERRIIVHLKQFLLELGKGFAFIGEQYKITLGNNHHYIDLVFYHRILKCFVLIDLKSNKASYADIGQMNMYMGYFEAEENMEDDNPPIGIVLAHEKDDLVIRYATSNLASNLFVSKYQLYLPDREELQRELEAIINQPEHDL